MSHDRIDALTELAEVSFLPESVADYSQPKRGRLRILIGLQRSGKSTYASKWVLDTRRKDKSGREYPRVIVCADNIRLAISGQRYNKHIEPAVFMMKDYMIEALLSSGHDCLCDETHTTKFSIKQNLKIDPDATYTLINTPVDICKQRAIATGQPDLVPVLDRTSRQLEALIAEGIPQVFDQLRKEISERYPS